MILYYIPIYVPTVAKQVLILSGPIGRGAMTTTD